VAAALTVRHGRTRAAGQAVGERWVWAQVSKSVAPVARKFQYHAVEPLGVGDRRGRRAADVVEGDE
jgi:hypothetical protein